MRVAPIRTQRLDLISISPAIITALVDSRRDTIAPTVGFAVPDGWPDDHDGRFLRLRQAQMLKEPSTQEWLVRAIIMRDRAMMTGHIGFHGPPTDGWAEMGYTVFEPHRRNGYAEESVRAMMRWARETHGIEAFRLSIDPGNEPSLALAAKLGFARIGEQIDPEDGLEYVFEISYR